MLKGFFYSFLGILFAYGQLTYSSKADLVIFAYDRDMQLYAYLESIEKYVQGLGDIIVIYRTSAPKFDVGFEIVKNRFSYVQFIKQSNNPHRDFKPLVMEYAFNKSKNDYIIFGVDDLIMKDYVDIQQCTTAMQKYGAYAFFLRLGINYNYCYPAKAHQPIPPMTYVENDMCLWEFKKGIYDFGYPNDLSMTIYNKSQVKTAIANLPFVTPNTFEGIWAQKANMNAKGLCFKMSKLVNIPANKVQEDNANHHMNSYSPSKLSDLFLKGYKIDIAPLFGIDNKACCVEWDLQFTQI